LAEWARADDREPAHRSLHANQRTVATKRHIRHKRRSIFVSYVPFCGQSFIVITDTDCFGRVVVNRRPAGIDLLSTVAARPLMVCISARPAPRTPSNAIVVTNQLVKFVFTALIKIVLPLRLAVASTSGVLMVVERRTSPRCAL